MSWRQLWRSRFRRVSRLIGTLRDRGSEKRSASTTEREPGTQTPATATTVDSNSFRGRGSVWAAEWIRANGGFEPTKADKDAFLRGYYGPTKRPPANSYTVRGSSTGAMDIPGASGAPRGPAV